MWFLAIRHLISRKKQSALTLAGVALGTMAYVTFAGIMTGFQGFMIDQLVNNDSHVRISSREDLLTEHGMDQDFFANAEHVFWISPPSGRKDSSRIDHPAGWFQRLDRDPRVLAYSPQIQAQVLITRGKSSLAGRLIGSDPNRQSRVTNIRQYMKQGDFLALGAGGNRLIAGDGLLNKLGARVGESLNIAVGKGESVLFRVVGSFHLGVVTIDNTTAFASLSDVQNVNQTPSQISDIAIRLTDVALAQQTANEWNDLAPDKVQSWDQANANILSVFAIQDFIRTFITIAIMVVAAFGIYNILNILVNQKRKDIGILRSIGFESNDIVRLFLIQGLILGTLGGALGLLAGFLLCLQLTTFKAAGMLDKMMVSFDPKIYLLGITMAVFASAISSILPARSAGKLKPIEILRTGE